MIEIAALDLGHGDTNLIKADKVFDFLLTNMEQNTWIGEQLYVAVKARIQDRRIPYYFGPLRDLDIILAMGPSRSYQSLNSLQKMILPKLPETCTYDYFQQKGK